MDFRNHLCRLGMVALMALAPIAGLSAAFAAQETLNKQQAWAARIFAEFLERHPNIAQDVNNNPSIVNDKDYLSKHPELKQFLDQHPAIKQELKKNPSVFLQQARTQEKSKPGPTKWQLETFGEFLEKHPDISQDLNKNPNLVNDQNYMSKHPELSRFLDQHSDLKDKLLDHPADFIQQVRQVQNSKKRK